MPPKRAQLYPDVVAEYFISHGWNFMSLECAGYKEGSVFARASADLLGVDDERGRRAIYYFWRRNRVVRSLVKESENRCGDEGYGIQKKGSAIGRSVVKCKSRLKGLIIRSGWRMAPLKLPSPTVYEVTNRGLPALELEGKFSFLRHEWAQMFIGGHFVGKNWTNNVSRKFFQINSRCVLLIHDYRVRKRTGDIVIRAYCKHLGCKKYILVCQLPLETTFEDITVSVYRQGEENHGSNKHCRPLRADDRDFAKRQLMSERALTVRSKAINAADEDAFMKGNMQAIHSLDVLRHARMEAKAADDYSKNAIRDVIEMYLKEKDNEDRYIQFVGLPLTVHCFSQLQIRLLSTFKKGYRPTLHLDATGSVVRRLPDFRKRVLYYAGVVNFDRVILPMCELISDRHDATTITSFLLNFLYYGITAVGIPCTAFDAVVCDFSFAIINAAVFAWSRCTLTRYLQDAHDIVSGNTNIEIHVPVVVCCAHFMHLIAKHLAKAFPNKKVRKFLKGVIALLVRANSIAVADSLFRYLCTLLKSEGRGKSVEDAIVAFKNMASDNSLAPSTLKRTAFPKSQVKSIRQYKSSPFYHRFVTISKDVHGDTTGDPNPFYSPFFLNLLLKRFIPYLPLWTNVIKGKGETKPFGPRYSNASVERWFGLVKNTILESDLHRRCGRFIRAVKPHVLARAKELQMGIPSVPSKRVKVDRGDVLGALTEEERWGKRGKVTGKRKVTSFTGEGISAFEVETANLSELFVDYVKGEEKPLEEDASDCTYWVKKGKRVTIDHMPLPFYDNGLVSDHSYYHRCLGISKPYVLGYVGNDIRVYLEDFLSLSPNQWLCNFIIDVVATVALAKNNSDILYIPCENSTHALKGNFTSEGLVSKFNFKGKRVLMPFNKNGNHWCLLFANFEEYSFTYFDPLGSTFTDIDNHKKMFTNFLKKRNTLVKEKIRAKTWKDNVMPFNKQIDSYNCGVHICYFINQLAKNMGTSEAIDADKYRGVMETLILENITKVTEICPLCDRGKFRGENTWIACDVCCRWYHLTCVDSTATASDFEKMAWCCVLCSKWVSIECEEKSMDWKELK